MDARCSSGTLFVLWTSCTYIQLCSDCSEPSHFFILNCPTPHFAVIFLIITFEIEGNSHVTEDGDVVKHCPKLLKFLNAITQ